MKKILIIVVGIIAILAATLYFVASPILKRYIEQNSYELIGRKIKLDKLSANVFSGKYKFYNLKIYEKNDKNVFLNFDTLVIKTSLTKLVKDKIHFEEITSIGMKAKIEQNGDKFNFSDIVEHMKGKSNEKEKEKQENEYTNVQLSNIYFKNCNINYLDKKLMKSWNSKNFTIKIPGFVYEGKSSKSGITINFENGGILTLKLNYDKFRKNFNLDANLSDFNLEQINKYINSEKIATFSGSANAKLTINGDAGHLINSSAKGTIRINDIAVFNTDKTKIYSANEVLLTVNRIDLMQNKFDFGNFSAKEMNAFFEIYKDGNNNFSKLISFNDTSKLNFNIAKINISNSSIKLLDKRFDNDVKIGIKNLNLTAENFSPNGNISIKLNADFTNGGRLIAQWNGKFDYESDKYIAVFMSNLRINDFSAYSEKYLGYPIAGGFLTVNLQNSVINSENKGAMDIQIYKAEIKNKLKNAQPVFDIPLQTALYLMKDSNNKISLHIPVEGNIKSPEFSYKKIISKAIAGYAKRIITSPFRIFSKPEKNDFITFNFMDSDFTPEQFNKIKSIADYAIANPNTHVIFKQYFNFKKYAEYFEILGNSNEVAISKVDEYSEIYNKQLAKYLQQNGLSADFFVIETAPKIETERYRGESKYTVAFEKNRPNKISTVKRN